MIQNREGVNSACPLKSTSPVHNDILAVEQLSSIIVDDNVPANTSVAEVAAEASKTCQQIASQTEIMTNGQNVFKRFSTVHLWAVNREASIEAVNPEGSAVRTAGLSLEAIRQSALLAHRSRLSRVVKLAQTSISGSIYVGVALAQPFDGLPGVNVGRRQAVKAAQRIS